jgi:hypothetical protein
MTILCIKPHVGIPIPCAEDETKVLQEICEYVQGCNDNIPDPRRRRHRWGYWIRHLNPANYGSMITSSGYFCVPHDAIQLTSGGVNIAIKDHFSGKIAVVHVPVPEKDKKIKGYKFEELLQYVVGDCDCYYVAFHTLASKIYPDQACFIGPDGFSLHFNDPFDIYNFCSMMSWRMDEWYRLNLLRN